MAANIQLNVLIIIIQTNNEHHLCCGQYVQNGGGVSKIFQALWGEFGPSYPSFPFYRSRFWPLPKLESMYENSSTNQISHDQSTHLTGSDAVEAPPFCSANSNDSGSIHIQGCQWKHLEAAS